jgi:hypothetical protein
VQVQEGQGWRLAVDPSRRPFPVLIGGSGWGAELTASEAWALRLGVGRLVREHRGLVATLLEEEAIELDLEVALGPGSLWLALEGDRGGWNRGRRSAMLIVWPSPALSPRDHGFSPAFPQAGGPDPSKALILGNRELSIACPLDAGAAQASGVAAGRGARHALRCRDGFLA